MNAHFSLRPTVWNLCWIKQKWDKSVFEDFGLLLSSLSFLLCPIQLFAARQAFGPARQLVALTRAMFLFFNKIFSPYLLASYFCSSIYNRFVLVSCQSCFFRKSFENIIHCQSHAHVHCTSHATHMQDPHCGHLCYIILAVTIIVNYAFKKESVDTQLSPVRRAVFSLQLACVNLSNFVCTQNEVWSVADNRNTDTPVCGVNNFHDDSHVSHILC